MISRSGFGTSRARRRGGKQEFRREPEMEAGRDESGGITVPASDNRFLDAVSEQFRARREGKSEGKLSRRLNISF